MSSEYEQIEKHVRDKIGTANVLLNESSEWRSGVFISNNSENRACRIVRFLSRLTEDVFGKILFVTDHKGELNIYWQSLPDQLDITCVENSWEYHAEFDIVHYLLR